MASVQPSHAEKELHKYTDTARTSSDLFPLLQHVDIADLRKFLHGQIDKMSASKACKAYYSMPINNILPSNVMQHILSFEDCNHYRDVCKQWNQLMNQNEENQIRAIHRSLTEQYSLSKENRIWILHAKRGGLHPLEKKLKYRFLKKLDEVRNQWHRFKSGDCVLVNNGCYTKGGMSRLDLLYNIHFIGISRSEPPIFCRRDLPIIKVEGQVTLENLSIGNVAVEQGKVVIRKCTVRSIKVHPGASLEVSECTLIHGKYTGDRSAIEVSPFARDVVVTKNTFKNFKRCVDITTAYERYGTRERATIRITDNVLQQVYGLFPFREYYGANIDDALFLKDDSHVISGNSVSPVTVGAKAKKLNYDPNELYCIDNLQRMQDNWDSD